MNKEKKTQNIKNELDWHKTNFYIDSGHWTSNPIFASRDRHWMFNEIEKIRFYSGLTNYISKKSFFKKARVLIAPVGNGSEIKYLEGVFSSVYGVDISGIALKNCPSIIKKKKMDILKMDYPNNYFDVVICPQFLHHVHTLGFNPYLKEFYRVLRPGGILAIQEPSILYPIVWIMSVLRRIIGNVTNLVEDECPIFPNKLTKNLKQIGFQNIQIIGLSFNHSRLPTVFQALNLIFDFPFRKTWPLKLFANGIGWYCSK